DSSQKFDHLEEFSGFSGPLIPIHIAEEERIRREHVEYISRMEMLFTINPHPCPTLFDNEASDFDNPSFPRPPSEPPDAEFDLKPDFEEKIPVVMNAIDELECLDPRYEFDDDDYSSFMSLIYFKLFSFLLSAESEDTIFDPGNIV
nr:hypothetical protein [Tanacetum cinerariifolium]